MMGFDLSPILYTALVLELIVGLIFVVAAYFLFRAVYHGVKAHLTSLHEKRLHAGLGGKRGLSHQPAKA